MLPVSMKLWHMLVSTFWLRPQHAGPQDVGNTYRILLSRASVSMDVESEGCMNPASHLQLSLSQILLVPGR